MMLEKALIEDEKAMTDMRLFNFYVKMSAAETIYRMVINEVLMDL